MIVDGNSSSMSTEIPRSYSNNNSVNEPRQNVSGEADDGWVVVSNRRKGRKT